MALSGKFSPFFIVACFRAGAPTSCILDPEYVEVCEAGIVGEQEVTSLRRTNPDCPIELYDPRMKVVREGGKELCDMFAVLM